MWLTNLGHIQTIKKVEWNVLLCDNCDEPSSCKTTNSLEISTVKMCEHATSSTERLRFFTMIHYIKILIFSFRTNLLSSIEITNCYKCAE